MGNMENTLEKQKHTKNNIMKKIFRKGSFYSVNSRYIYKLKYQENYEYILKNHPYNKYIYACNRLSL